MFKRDVLNVHNLLCFPKLGSFYKTRCLHGDTKVPEYRIRMSRGLTILMDRCSSVKIIIVYRQLKQYWMIKFVKIKLQTVISQNLPAVYTHA